MLLTLSEKIWRRDVAGNFGDGRALLAIGRRVVRETAGWHACDVLRDRGLTMRPPELTWSLIDHSIATRQGHTPDGYPLTRDVVQCR